MSDTETMGKCRTLHHVAAFFHDASEQDGIDEAALLSQARAPAASGTGRKWHVCVFPTMAGIDFDLDERDESELEKMMRMQDNEATAARAAAGIRGVSQCVAVGVAEND